MSLAAILMLRNENKLVYGINDEIPNKTMLRQQLEFLSEFVDDIFIMDGDSTDKSQDVYREFSKIRYVGIQSQLFSAFNENEILNLLLTKAKENKNKWLLSLDGDEILSDSAVVEVRKIVNEYNDKKKHTIRFNYINLWRSRKKYRVDKWYNSNTGKLFSLNDDLISVGTEFNNHHFCFGEKDNFGKVYETGKKILHYAWVDWNNIIKKKIRCIDSEYYFNKTDSEIARKMYDILTDEEGIILRNVDKQWLKEYR